MKYLPSIVAVHGLGAHPEFTWTTIHEQAHPLPTQSSSDVGDASNRINWLKDDEFLKKDFKTAGIMTFGYNADWFIGAPMATAELRAWTLLRELKRARASIGVCYLLLQHNILLTTDREDGQYCSSDIALAASS